MSEEYFDVVDLADRVIGRATRNEVHQKGLYHRAVHVLVFNSQGQLFLQKRSASKDTFPGKWDSSASGHLCAGEEYDDCAVRELEEEIGLRAATAPERVFKIDACAETGQEHVWVYQCVSDGPLSLNVDEVEHGEWFTKGAIDQWLRDKPGDFASAFPRIWKAYQKR